MKTLKYYLPKEFFLNEEGKMVTEISLDDLNGILDILTNYEELCKKYKLVVKALSREFTKKEEYEYNDFLRQLINTGNDDKEWLERMAGVYKK